jgi:hypothetical protein
MLTYCSRFRQRFLFWTAGQFEPLIVEITLPLSHIPSYAGPWVVKGTDKGEQFELALRQGFKGGDPKDPVELHELEGLLREVWQEPEGGSQAVLQQFLAWASNFPPMQKYVVRPVLSGSKQRLLPETGRRERHRPGDD